MNLLLLDGPGGRTDNRVMIRGRALEHLQRVLGADTGDRVRVGRVNGAMGYGRILHIGPESAELELDLTEAPPPPLPVTLVLALPRPKMLKRILQAVASLGVKQLHLINSYRVEKSYWQTPWLAPDNLRQQLLLGLEQARDTVLPQVTLHNRFKPFVEDQLPALAAGTLALVAHPGSVQRCPVAVAGPVTLAVGPEGGFIDYELEKLREAGLQPVALGPRILRVETAIPVLLSRLVS